MHASIDILTKALPRLCKVFRLERTFTSCTDEVRIKVPSFKKAVHFFNIKYSSATLSVYIFLKMLLTAVSLLQSASSFLPRNNMKTKTISSLIIEIQL